MFSSSSSLDSADLTSAKRKIAPLFADFSSLPASVIDPLWTDVRAEAGLTLGEMGALKNARCAPAGKDHNLYLYSAINAHNAYLATIAPPPATQGNYYYLKLYKIQFI